MKKVESPVLKRWHTALSVASAASAETASTPVSDCPWLWPTPWPRSREYDQVLGPVATHWPSPAARTGPTQSMKRPTDACRLGSSLIFLPWWAVGVCVPDIQKTSISPSPWCCAATAFGSAGGPGDGGARGARPAAASASRRSLTASSAVNASAQKGSADFPAGMFPRRKAPMAS